MKKRMLSLSFALLLPLSGALAQPPDRGGDQGKEKEREKGDQGSPHEVEKKGRYQGAPEGRRLENQPQRGWEPSKHPKEGGVQPNWGMKGEKKEGQPAPQRFQMRNPSYQQSPGFPASRKARRGWTEEKRTFSGAIRDRQPAHVPEKLRSLGVSTLPKPILAQKKMVTTAKGRSVIRYPARGPAGKPLSAKLITPHSGGMATVQSHMSLITSRPSLINQVNYYNAKETRTNNYYWHTVGGTTFCHYYDPWGYNWYGWYVGPNFFWTRYYYNRWWWYDDAWDRWCYWYNGWWWWQDPFHVEVVYVYDGDRYVPAGPGYSDTVVETEIVARSGDLSFRSEDETRMVRVVGKHHDAILYDTADPASFRPVYLDSGVKEVKFSNTRSGAPLQVILFLRDGSFEMFDGEGNRYDTGAEE